MPKPKLYVPRRGLVMMKVEKPYIQVANWCRGTVIKHGLKFAYIRLRSLGEVQHASAGSYISLDEEIGDFHVHVRPENVEDFFRQFREARPGECENEKL